MANPVEDYIDLTDQKPGVGDKCVPNALICQLIDNQACLAAQVIQNTIDLQTGGGGTGGVTVGPTCVELDPGNTDIHDLTDYTACSTDVVVDILFAGVNGDNNNAGNATATGTVTVLCDGAAVGTDSYSIPSGPLTNQQSFSVTDQITISNVPCTGVVQLQYTESVLTGQFNGKYTLTVDACTTSECAP